MPADLGSGVRFHPATLSDALVDHDADDVDRLLGIVEFDLLGGFDNRRWWFTIEVVRVPLSIPTSSSARRSGAHASDSVYL